jgi:asparagine synthase (glutamine-hydrolysing)
MCGICGTVVLDSGPVGSEDVLAMMRSMAHRGPDAEGLFEEPGIVAGIRRLAVIDVKGGGQPISNEDGTVKVVFNGEIYNYRELTTELLDKGHHFSTRSDTEVLVHLWEQEGPELVHRLNGMFSFCIHDSRTGETFIARDRLGIKPLFYMQKGRLLAFASEIPVLLRHGAARDEIDISSLVELFMLQYLSGDNTIYRGIRKLLPGHAIHVRNGSVSILRYYSIPDTGPRPGRSVKEWAVELRELLESSVRYRLISDVPLGMFLSGGIDSSATLSLVADLVDHPVRTFSVGFEGDAALDERKYAKLAAESRNCDHHELLLSAMEIAEQLPRLIAHLGEPVVDPAIIPTYLLSEYARRRVTVVLTGEGADELFGGYRRYLYQRRYGWLGRCSPIAGLLPRRAEQALQAMSEKEPVAKHLQWSSVVGYSAASRLFEHPLFESFKENSLDRFSTYFSGGGIRLGDQLRADQHEWLPHNLLAKVDRASMAFSLEARVPFLDHRVVEWASEIPEDLKIRGATTKFILREAFKDRLPAEILRRPKRGFDLPLAAWIRGPLRQLVSDLLTPTNLKRWDGLQVEEVGEMLDRHLRGREDFGLPLFNILSIMIFLEGQRSR